MFIVREQNGNFIRYTSLWEALALPETSPLVISIVGAGGKTSTMFRLAEEAEASGKKAIVTTSTHIWRPDGYPVVLADTWQEIGSVRWERGILVVGQPAKEQKLKGLPEEQIGRLTEWADVVLVEADGAKCLPVKVPGSHEPVVVPGTDVVIACAGLDSIGKPLNKICFRKELAAELLGVDEHHLLTPGDLAVILLHEKGSRKSVNGAAYRMILNKADDSQREEYGREVIKEIRRLGQEEVLLTSRLRRAE